jgi:glycosyltransferase involved in cell wall biosynthesis
LNSTYPFKISVIVPFHNEVSFIYEAVESILAQSVKNIEMITVDDGSIDDSAEKLQLFNDPRIKIIRQENSGASVARNMGVRESTGEYICFLDADDKWAPFKLKLQIEALEKDPSLNMIFGQVKEFNDESIRLKTEGMSDEKIFVGYSPITLLISRNDFLKVGWFQEKWKVGEFIDWYDRAKQLNFKEIVLPEIVAYRRIHSGNLDRLHRPDAKQYVAVLKEALDRRRKNQQ